MCIKEVLALLINKNELAIYFINVTLNCLSDVMYITLNSFLFKCNFILPILQNVI
jgi:hypothetical protein